MLTNSYSCIRLLFGVLLTSATAGISHVAAQTITASAVPSTTLYLDATGHAVLTAAQLNSGSSSTSSCSISNAVTLSLIQAGAPNTVTATVNEFYQVPPGINVLEPLNLTAPTGSTFYQVNSAILSAREGTCTQTANLASIVAPNIIGERSVVIPSIVLNTADYQYDQTVCAGSLKKLTVTASYAPSRLEFTTAGAYEVTLLATDACGNVSLATPTMVYVVQSCGPKNNQKVSICHNGVQTCVDEASLPAHLAHGDSFGACSTTPRLVVNASPNPAANGQFNVNVEAATTGPVSVALFNMQGTLVSQLFNGQMEAGEQRSFNVNRSDLRQGFYTLRVQDSQNVETFRVENQK